MNVLEIRGNNMSTLKEKFRKRLKEAFVNKEFWDGVDDPNEMCGVYQSPFLNNLLLWTLVQNKYAKRYIWVLRHTYLLVYDKKTETSEDIGCFKRYGMYRPSISYFEDGIMKIPNIYNLDLTFDEFCKDGNVSPNLPHEC
jgi:hypothetical protein